MRHTEVEHNKKRTGSVDGQVFLGSGGGTLEKHHVSPGVEVRERNIGKKMEMKEEEEEGSRTKVEDSEKSQLNGKECPVKMEVTLGKNGLKSSGGAVRTNEGCRKKMLSATPKSRLLENYHDQLEQDGVSLPSKYEIISIREKHSQFRKAVPCMPLPVAILLCLINLAAPGVGTLLSGLTVLCGCRTEHETRSKAILYNVAAAILQLIMAPIIVGWVWSIMWGITFVNLSITKALQEPIPEAKI